MWDSQRGATPQTTWALGGWKISVDKPSAPHVSKRYESSPTPSAERIPRSKPMATFNMTDVEEQPLRVFRGFDQVIKNVLGLPVRVGSWVLPSMLYGTPMVCPLGKSIGTGSPEIQVQRFTDRNLKENATICNGRPSTVTPVMSPAAPPPGKDDDDQGNGFRRSRSRRNNTRQISAFAQ
ncbi:hypothetical protein BC826DRAFT_967907 [Russula brevipes]|nr:hypothetical protein BC826DRAFT_967907 [Russula brevipes]